MNTQQFKEGHPELAQYEASLLMPCDVIDCRGPSNGLSILQEILEAVRIPEEYLGRKVEVA